MPRGFETTTGGGSGGGSGAATGGVAQAAFDALVNEVAKKDNKVTPGLNEILIVDALGNQLPSGKKFTTDNTMGSTGASDALSPTQKAVYDFVQAVKTALIDGASIAGDTLKELEDRIIAIESAFAVGADADTIINRLTELYQLVENIPEGTSLLLELNKRLQYGATTDRPVAAISNNNMFWLDDTGIYKSDGTTWVKLFNTAGDSTETIIEVNGDTYFDTSGLSENQKILVCCVADGELDIQPCRIMNRRIGDTLGSASGGPNGTTYSTGLDLVAGEVFYIFFKSPTEAYYQKLREANLADAAVEYWAEYWVSNEKGLSTNHGKSIEAPYQTVQNFLDGWIDFGSRVHIMSDYGHPGGWTLADQNFITFEGAGKTSMMYGGIELTGLCEHVTFRNLHIAGDITWSGQTALTFSDSGGNHLLEGMMVIGNTAPVYIQFGTNCHNAVVKPSDARLAATFRDCDFSDAGKISLPDLPAGQGAAIRLENTKTSEIEIGDGWYVFHDADSTVVATYTGSATSSQLINTTLSVLPINDGGIITRSNFLGSYQEIAPTAKNLTLKSREDIPGFINISWDEVGEYPAINSQVTNQSGSNMTAMLHQFKVSDGNYQSFDIVIDIWESGVGASVFDRFVKLSGRFRMDLIAAAGTVDIANYIDRDDSDAPKGTLSLVYNPSGYGGAGIELQYQILVPFTNLNINKRVLLHTSGN